MPHPVV